MQKKKKKDKQTHDILNWHAIIIKVYFLSTRK